MSKLVRTNRAFVSFMRRLLLLCGVGLLLALVVPATRAQEEGPEAAATPEAPRQVRPLTGQVLDSGGQPIVRAIVYARRVGGPPNASPRSAVTDAGGQFTFAKLPPGAYALWASAPGYVNHYAPQRGPGGRITYYRPGGTATLTLVKGGVVTGRVTNSDGEAIVNATVRLTRVRDVDGGPTKSAGWYNVWMFSTDDRGIYRIYGIEPGIYVASFGGSSQEVYGRNSLHEEDAPTYHPSATRDAATEITVREGQEVGGIDIRHRGERGHAVRGVVTGALSGGSDWDAVSVNLRSAATGVDEAFTYVREAEDARAWKFDMSGVPDGEYEVVASRGGWRMTDVFSAAPVRITVKGADVTGVELKLAPLASIAGRVTYELLPRDSKTEANAPPNCPPAGPPPAFSEVALAARRSEAHAAAKPVNPFRPSGEDSVPGEAGNFVLRNLEAGRYRLMILAPNENWYVRGVASAVKSSTAGGGGRVGDAGELVLRAGESLRDVTITLAEGAAAIRGGVTPAGEGQTLPVGLIVYAVPAGQPDDVARYAEASVEADGKFNLTNLAPGKYWLITRRLKKAEMSETALPVLWDAGARTTLYRAAEAAKVNVELKPCEKLTDQVLSYPPAK